MPLTDNPQVPKALGTRHRAGIGLSEAEDALVVIVSEETGAVSLAEGGRLVIPVGWPGSQNLVLIVKEHGQLRRRQVLPVAFVPMTGPGVERQH